MLTNNYFCTLKYKIMKGILPVYCRTMGYVVLLLSVFVPLFMFMFGMIYIGLIWMIHVMRICKHHAR